jgi:hypothetical protein
MRHCRSAQHQKIRELRSLLQRKAVFFQGVRSLDFFSEFKGSDPLKERPLEKQF